MSFDTEGYLYTGLAGARHMPVQAVVSMTEELIKSQAPIRL